MSTCAFAATMAKCLCVNIRPGEIANQRHLTGQANRIIKGFQDSPNLNMVEGRGGTRCGLAVRASSVPGSASLRRPVPLQLR